MVELTWEGKYDADGKRAAPLRIQLPFQTIETVNESALQHQMALDLFSVRRVRRERANGVDHVIELLYYRDKPG
jgi:hypothetical protein